MTLGNNIKKIRKEKKLTQQQLASKMGISRSYLSDVENDRYNPSSKTIESLAEKLDVSMFYLTTGDKALSDLTDGNKKLKSYLKEELKKIIDVELHFLDARYLEYVLHFLKVSNTQEIIGLTSIIDSLIRTIEYKNGDNIDKEELKAFLNNELNDNTKLLHDYFFNDNKDGE